MTDQKNHILYQAILNRDASYDGLVYFAVSTTGIYCRPVCPAPKPKKTNTSFYISAAEAQEAGYRPCKRCRPETRQGSPAWQGSEATITKAKRLITSGGFEDKSLPAIADSLGIGERHFRRLFKQHEGVSPLQYALQQKLSIAKLLLGKTDASIASIAFECGFKSLRRFNDAFKSQFNITPSNWRKNHGRKVPL